VIPTRGLWLLMIFLIGVFGIIGQVCHFSFYPCLALILVSRKTLLAMGFQRETASRGTLAMYTSVRPACHFHVRNVTIAVLFLGCLCRRARVHRFSYDAYPALDRRVDHYHELGYLHVGAIPSYVSSQIHNFVAHRT
jgi:hypothetical protein